MEEKDQQLILKQLEEEDRKHKEMMKAMGFDMDDMADVGFGDPELDALNDMLSKFDS